MRIVLPVTPVAVGCEHDLGYVLGDVARMAIEAAVRPSQWVARLCVVIEPPSRPAIRVVTERTICPQAPIMMLVAVARAACQRCILKPQRAVAFLARHHGMAPDQRKPRDVMIEGRYAAPIVLAMASLAANTEPAVVPVVLAMAGHTGRRQLVMVEIAGVAGIALHLCMCGPERKLGRFVVIEANRGPLVLVVARLASGSVPSGMDILNLVAVDAGRADSLVAFADMAAGARDIAVRGLQREPGLVVV